MSTIQRDSERHSTAVLDPTGSRHDGSPPTSQAVIVRNQNHKQGTLRTYLYSCLVGLLGLSLTFYKTGAAWLPFGPKFSVDDYVGRTRHVLSTTPLIDGHNDLPYVIRQELKNKINGPKFDFGGHLLSHTDLNKMRTGQFGGQFWSVFMECLGEGAPQLEDPTVCQTSIISRYLSWQVD